MGAIGFAMDGAHLELECTECHENAEARVVPEGEHRYIGLSQRCVTCHEDVHDGEYLTTCIVCHEQSAFEEVDYVADRVKEQVERLREMSPLWEMVQDGIDLDSIQWTPH